MGAWTMLTEAKEREGTALDAATFSGRMFVKVPVAVGAKEWVMYRG